MTKTQILKDALAAGATLKQAAEKAGLSYDAARGIAARLRKQKAEKPAVTPQQARYQEAARRLERAAKEAEQVALEQREVRETVFGLAATSAEPPAWTFDSKAGAGVTGIPVAIWSDWHLGEVVELAETNGANAFNMAVADARIKNLVGTTIDLCKNHMVNTDYPGIVVMLGGDMVTGEIHDELTRTNDLDPLPTVLWARDRITAGLRDLANAFGRVFVPCVAGNHGRMSKRVEHKHFAVRNFDWLISTLCEKYFHDIGDDRVKFYIPESNEALFRVYSHRYLLVHGHDLGVGGGDGIIGALGPIMRGKMKVGNQKRAMDQDFDTVVMGHWHQYIQLKGLVVNGTLKGFDGFANAGLRAAPEPATQALWFTHPKHGITARWPVFLQSQGAAVAKSWVSWAA